jgi:hypothetical protein
MVGSLLSCSGTTATTLLSVWSEIQTQAGALSQTGEEIVGISPLAYFGTIVLIVIVALVLDIVFIIKACNKL